MVDAELAFVTSTLARIAAMPPELGDGTLFTGGTGVAYFLVEAARLLDRPDLVPLARGWLGSAAEPGLITGGVGTRFVEVLVTIAERRAPDDSIAAIAAEVTSETELFRGSAGIARAAAVLASHVTDERSRRVLEDARDRMVAHVLAAHSQPLAPRPKDRLGMAHGIAGELWTLVVALGPDHPIVAARLEELAELRMMDLDELVFWPPTLASEPEQADFSTWCNGVAGHTMLWSEVARRAPTWRELAGQVARTTLALEGDAPTLCCGLAGQALALHKYAAIANDAEVAHAADERLRKAIAMTAHDDLSLWHGVTGVAMVALFRVCGSMVWPCLETMPM